MKCDYCELEALYSMAVIKDEGKDEIWTCDEHKYLGSVKQQSILRNLEMRDIIKLSNSFIK